MIKTLRFKNVIPQRNLISVALDVFSFTFNKIWQLTLSGSKATEKIFFIIFLFSNFVTLYNFYSLKVFDVFESFQFFETLVSFIDRSFAPLFRHRHLRYSFLNNFNCIINSTKKKKNYQTLFPSSPNCIIVVLVYGNIPIHFNPSG